MAAGTGREREEERLALVMDWMWGTVLPDLQSVADQGGFGAEWRTMCVEKSPEAARAAAGAARAAAWAAEAAGAAAGDAAGAAAGDAAGAAAGDAAGAAAGDAAGAAAGDAAGAAAWAAGDAAWAAAGDAAGAARDAAWERYDPVGLLARLVAETEEV